MDIRVPVGAIFAIYGLLLTIYGFSSGDLEPRHMIGSLNVNIWDGLGMLVFGGGDARARAAFADASALYGRAASPRRTLDRRNPNAAQYPASQDLQIGRPTSRSAVLGQISPFSRHSHEQ